MAQQPPLSMPAPLENPLTPARQVQEFLEAVRKSATAAGLRVSVHCKPLCFTDGADKANWAPCLSTDDAAERCDVFSAFTKTGWEGQTARVGLLTACMDTWVGYSTEDWMKHEWHAQVVLGVHKSLAARAGRALIIFDPAYDPSEHPGEPMRSDLKGKARVFVEKNPFRNGDVWLAPTPDRPDVDGRCLHTSTKCLTQTVLRTWPGGTMQDDAVRTWLDALGARRVNVTRGRPKPKPDESSAEDGASDEAGKADI